MNLIRRTKGGRLHRIVGRIWAAAMFAVILMSFGIRTIDGGFIWLHGLSVLTFCTLTAGLFAAYKRNIRAHRSFMTGSYFGLIGAFVGVLARRTRIKHCASVVALSRLLRADPPPSRGFPSKRSGVPRDPGSPLPSQEGHPTRKVFSRQPSSGSPIRSVTLFAMVPSANRRRGPGDSDLNFDTSYLARFRPAAPLPVAASRCQSLPMRLG